MGWTVPLVIPNACIFFVEARSINNWRSNCNRLLNLVILVKGDSCCIPHGQAVCSAPVPLCAYVIVLGLVLLFTFKRHALYLFLVVVAPKITTCSGTT